MFNSTFFGNLKAILLLSLSSFEHKNNILKNSLSSMLVVRNKEQDLDKAVWVNQVVLFLQSFCFTIELLAFQASNSNQTVALSPIL